MGNNWFTFTCLPFFIHQIQKGKMTKGICKRLKFDPIKDLIEKMPGPLGIANGIIINNNNR